MRTPEVKRERARVTVAMRLRNELEQAARCKLTIQIVDAAGTSVATETSDAQIGAGAEYVFEQALMVGNPALWSDTIPHLYTARQSLQINGAEIDAETTPFGIRETRFDADRVSF